MIWLLSVLVAALVAVILYLSIRLDRLSERESLRKSTDHAICLSMVAAFVGDEWAASVLDAAADHYTSLEGQAEIKQIAHRRDSLNIPATWMQERAEAMRAKRRRYES